MSRSTSGASPGFTLLEMLIASALGVTVMTIAVNAYMSANKAQSATIAGGLIKSIGQASLHELYFRLHQSHTLFDRGAIANSWLTKVPVSGHYAAAGALTPGYAVADLELPLVTPTAAFSPPDPAAVGNALLFAVVEPDAVMREEGGGTELQTAFGSSEVHLTPFRLQFFVLARRPLPVRAPVVRPSTSYTYQLMSWTSQPYLDLQDMTRWITRLKARGVSNGYIDTKLAKLRSPDATPAGTGAFAGIIDLSATTAAASAYQLVANGGYTGFTAESAPFATYQYRALSKMNMTQSVGELFVAFNTTGTPAFRIPPLDVPAYAVDTATKPFGFETLVGGPLDARQVLVRIAYAARTHPGRQFQGQTFQQIVQVHAELPATAATAAPTVLPATPTPAPSVAGSTYGGGGSYGP